MVKNNSYTIPPRFRLGFIIIAGLAYIGNTVPYILLLLQDHTIYGSVANTTLLVADAVVPLVVGLIAAALTHRRSIGRWWIAAGAGFVVGMIEQLLISAGSYIAPMNYEQLNIAAVIIAAGMTLWAVWYDRFKTGRSTRHWRVAGIGTLYGLAVIAAVADTMRSIQSGQDAASMLAPLGLTLGCVAVAVGVALYVYRQLPVVERVKRVVLAFTTAVLLTMAVGGLLSLIPVSQTPLIGAEWVGIVVAVGGYIVAVWLLVPSVAHRVYTRKARA